MNHDLSHDFSIACFYIFVKGGIGMRETILLNQDWLFHEGDILRRTPQVKGPVYCQSKTERMKWGPACINYNDCPDDFRQGVEYGEDKWLNVTLPHDYIIRQEPKEEENNALGFFTYRNAWYRKHLNFGEEDKNKRIRLYFEGIATISTVYFNGTPMKRNESGYTSFEVDLTDYIRIGEDNVIAVYVDTSQHEGWWYEGAGIYRDAWLIKTDRVAVDTDGVYVRPEKEEDDRWRVHLETTVFNEDYDDVTVEAVTALYDKDGAKVAEAKTELTIPTKDVKTAVYETYLQSPHLWDIDDPYQYRVVTEVFRDGASCDVSETKTGFHTYYADPEKGFFLNGRHVKIKGVCMHQDCGLTGKAVAANVQRYKIELLKEMGANGYRASHYMQTASIMDALDDLGFIVMAETRWFDSTENGKKQLRTMMKRDRNRPSIFFWSVGNEEFYFVNEQGRNIAKSLIREVRKLDPSRLVMTATDKSPDVATVFEELDAGGINYNLQKFDPIHEKFPKLPIFSSECCATGTTRGWYFEDDPDKQYLSAYDKRTNSWFMGREETWNFMMEREYILGAYQWISFEHRGEAVWPRVCSQSGAIDLFLQKKDAFYQNQSHWSDQPMIHMLPHWNLPHLAEGENVNVWAYTNCEEAELILNGKSFGRVKVEKYRHVEWDVPYEKGKVEVIGYNGGVVAARDGHVTSGKAAKLMLKLDNKVTGSGHDVAILTCYCVDEAGNEVPDAAPFVDFRANRFGRVIGTGSDVSDHRPLPEMGRKMRAGRIGVAVAVAGGTGVLSVYAESEGLVPARLDVELV